MKRNNLIACLGAAFGLVFGAAAFSYSNDQGAVEAKADGTVTLYCKMTYSWWTQDNAAIGAYYWDGDSDPAWPGVRMTAVPNDAGVWEIEIPSSYKKVIFTRVNGSGTIADWGAQTEDLTIPTDGKNLYTITSSTAKWAGSDEKVTGSWSVYGESEPSEDPVEPGVDPEEPLTPGQENLTGKQATYYQLLTYSFADGDGDGIGDFKGLCDHVDYLKNLGIGGVYLSPFNQAYSYHSYDVLDYYAENSLYVVTDGSVTYDLAKVVEVLHENGIKVIVDMVLNHSSIYHPWRSSHPSWYISDSSKWVFYGDADFNYDNIELRNEIKNIGRHWLTEAGVDGYRLDAVRYLYSVGGGYETTYAQHLKNVQFWGEFYETCREVNPNVYMVGEDFIYDEGELLLYESSGCDSFFDFPMSYYVESAAYSGYPNSYVTHVVDWQRKVRNANSNGIPASFLSNHDRGRFGSDLSPARYCLAGFMNVMAPGNSYVYYGDELNLQATMSSGYEDMLYRTSMPFASGRTTMNTYFNAPHSMTYFQGTSASYSGATADADAASPNSIYAAYAKAIALKNHNPVLYDGTVYLNGNADNPSIGSLIVTDGATTVTVVYNASENVQTLALTEGNAIIGYAAYSGNSYKDGEGNLKLAPCSVTLLEGAAELSSNVYQNLYLRGDMNSWGTSNDFRLVKSFNSERVAKVSNVYLEKGTAFKIASDDWNQQCDYSGILSVNGNKSFGDYFTAGENGNIVCGKTGYYNFYVSTDFIEDGGCHYHKLYVYTSDYFEHPDGVYLRGSWANNDGWTAEKQKAMIEDVYCQEYHINGVALEENTDLKAVMFEEGVVRDDDFYWLNCDSVTFDDPLFPAVAIDDGNLGLNAKVGATGLYDIAISYDTKKGTWSYSFHGYEDPVLNAAIAYAHEFNQTIGSVCNAGGNTDLKALKDAFADMESAFLALSTDARNMLRVEASSSAIAELSSFAAKYDYIIAKYGLELNNFAMRGPLVPAPAKLGETQNIALPMSLVALALVGVSLGIVFIRRRKRAER
ncbi:MAG: hypothetical protein E7179_00385 [Erysipelotrichaceae bacterium]|jgi:glycosidase|nr:hypothetical protein [Erysipelotrichaceae bacterium]